ncbi:hypothetical protein CALCODRAFT_182388 [Calocera cornea HHB12733]|uniref:Uncharacterized protein n=1 Tax=Calocera cornea HHB12733 TaxID=1353952 RepID=A0A165HRZ7_9BASI|nr:hypothetical protein CALCODRAFT_182388 [Calocera cornea HHB12733]
MTVSKACRMYPVVETELQCPLAIQLPSTYMLPLPRTLAGLTCIFCHFPPFHSIVMVHIAF